MKLYYFWCAIKKCLCMYQFVQFTPKSVSTHVFLPKNYDFRDLKAIKFPSTRNIQ